MSYSQFIERKQLRDAPSGFDASDAPMGALFHWQADIVRWALRRGRAALFEDCGLGKTPQQLMWADAVCRHAHDDVLILTPLAVADQTVREGQKFGIECRYCRSQAEVKPGITVANYEMLESFDPGHFAGVVLDESSILKAFMGKTKRRLLESFARTPYRLACTATPAPNDCMELGNHAEFLGVMPSPEMLARWFINDTARVGHYRLKGHAEQDFWEWVASWAVCISKPSDIGHADGEFVLPPLRLREVIVRLEGVELWEEGAFLPKPTLNATDIHQVMRKTAGQRAEAAAELALACDDPFILWCNTDYEADAICEALPEAVEVRGSESLEAKREKLSGFSNGDFRMIVTKPRIAGFGLNWQHCHNMAFVGLSYSYEQIYQSIRRSYRFGQTRPVNVHLVATDAEVGVMESIKRKQADHRKMQRAMVAAMREAEIRNLNPNIERRLTNLSGRSRLSIPSWVTAQ